jgi:hypothetical protein
LLSISQTAPFFFFPVGDLSEETLLQKEEIRMKKRLFVTFLCCSTLFFFLACRANAERPFTEVTFGFSRDEVEAVEPDFANLTQLEKSRYDWSCNRTFSGEVGLLGFRFIEGKVDRITWLAHPATEDAQALFDEVVKATTACYGKPDYRHTDDIEAGESVASSRYTWKLKDSSVYCNVFEEYQTGTCVVLFHHQLFDELTFR